MIEVDLSELQPSLQALSGSSAANPYDDFETFFEAATLAFQEFPRNVRATINAFARKGDPDGVLVIRGFPTDPQLPPTPAHPGARATKSTYVSEFWLACIASVLGEPAGYLQEKGGRIVHDIYPTEANADKLASDSSAINLDFHTELAFHPYLPDYVLLYGLRPDPEQQAKTSFAGIQHLLPSLTAEQRRILAAPLFRAGIDYSFGSTNGMRGNGPVTKVLYGHPDDPYLRFDLDLMEGMTPEAERCLHDLIALIREQSRHIVIEAGTLLVLENHRCVHARSRFKARFDGTDRWLQRMLVVKDITQSSGDRVPGGRVIATDFSNYLKLAVESEV